MLRPIELNLDFFLAPSVAENFKWYGLYVNVQFVNLDRKNEILLWGIILHAKYVTYLFLGK